MREQERVDLVRSFDDEITTPLKDMQHNNNMGCNSFHELNGHLLLESGCDSHFRPRYSENTFLGKSIEKSRFDGDPLRLIVTKKCLYFC